jgi:hypothetical protein
MRTLYADECLTGIKVTEFVSEGNAYGVRAQRCYTVVTLFLHSDLSAVNRVRKVLVGSSERLQCSPNVPITVML